MMRLYFLILLFLSVNAIGQRQNDKWYFGNNAALDFSSGSPASILNSAMVSSEGCASVADKTSGNLLFYTNGINIWNANNDTMPNGTGLLAGAATSSTQGVAIVPQPFGSNNYFVFTTDETNHTPQNGLRYSVVDMTLNAGLGDVVANQKNRLLLPNASERLAVALKADGKGYWVMTHQRGNNNFSAFEVTTQGVNPVPVTSSVGVPHSTIYQTTVDETMGYLKFNQQYTRVAVALFEASKIQVFDFDNCTGVVSNPVTISTLDNPYGLEFSPDGSKLYFTLLSLGAVYQTNLLAANIAASAVPVGLTSSINQSLGALQLAPDGKIYVAVTSESWLSAINQPDSLAAACQFADQAVTIQSPTIFPHTAFFGLPQTVVELKSAFTQNEILVRDTCINSGTISSLADTTGVQSVFWNFDDPNSGVKNTSTLLEPAHQFTAAGNYAIQATIGLGCTTDTLKSIINISDCDTSNTNCRLIFSDAFTPNGDGKNDLFSAVCNCKPSLYNLSIINRWGEVVFQTDSYSNKWDGKFKGNECVSGTYIYFAQYKLGSDAPQKINGAVTLLR